MSPELANSLLSAKELARHNRSARNWTLLIGVVVGLVVACTLLVIGFLHLSASQLVVFGVAGGASASAIFIQWRSRYLEEAKCPVCQTSWEIAEGRTVLPKAVMTNWKICPGCKTPMDDQTLMAVKQNTGREATPSLKAF